MSRFNVSLEINTESENPLEAAKEVQEMVRDIYSDWQFYVQNHETKEIFSVDLNESDDDAVLPVKPEDYTPVIEK